MLLVIEPIFSTRGPSIKEVWRIAINQLASKKWVLFQVFMGATLNKLDNRGRDTSYLVPPTQIPSCPIKAMGSSVSLASVHYFKEIETRGPYNSLSNPRLFNTVAIKHGSEVLPVITASLTPAIQPFV